MKKLLQKYAPYLLLLYPFNKVFQAFRLTPGADLGEKLRSLGEGFSAAFHKLSPGWQLFEIMGSLLAVAVIWLIVLLKSGKPKKYRIGEEYGSARWGTAVDIAPYMDEDFFRNIPMTKTEYITMASRPKQPKYARNKNILVIGGSGSGKTRFFCKPSLLQAHSSYVVTDPNGYNIPR